VGIDGKCESPQEADKPPLQPGAAGPRRPTRARAWPLSKASGRRSA